jgi:hypothetical protein
MGGFKKAVLCLCVQMTMVHLFPWTTILKKMFIYMFLNALQCHQMPFLKQHAVLAFLL